MHDDTFRAIEDGATVVTASRRLARVLREEFDLHQRALARSVWETPDILPLDAFLNRTWRDWVLSGANPDAPALLNGLQEQFIWEQVIRSQRRLVGFRGLVPRLREAPRGKQLDGTGTAL